MKETKYKIGSLIYLLHDPEQRLRQIIGYTVTADNIRYCLVCGLEESWHYEFELAVEKNMLYI